MIRGGYTIAIQRSDYPEDRKREQVPSAGRVLSTLEEHSHSFLVRLWFEEGSSDWRGRVIHIQGNQQRTIHSLDELKPFIEQFAVPGPRIAKEGYLIRWLQKLMTNKRGRE